jgi:hypothetical protein
MSSPNQIECVMYVMYNFDKWASPELIVKSAQKNRFLNILGRQSLPKQKKLNKFCSKKERSDWKFSFECCLVSSEDQ